MLLEEEIIATDEPGLEELPPSPTLPSDAAAEASLGHLPRRHSVIALQPRDRPSLRQRECGGHSVGGVPSDRGVAWVGSDSEDATLAVKRSSDKSSKRLQRFSRSFGVASIRCRQGWGPSCSSRTTRENSDVIAIAVTD